MNTAAKWGIALGVGIPGVLILIGLLGLILKFIMKKCRRKAWVDINSLPKRVDSSDNSTPHRLPHLLDSDQEPLVPTTIDEAPTTTNVINVSDAHVSVPLGTDELTASENQRSTTTTPEVTLVQAQRDRLSRLREEENRTRPTLPYTINEFDIERVIQEAQKDFEESV